MSCSLFAETHGDWSAPLPAAQAGTLMRMQFLARRQSYGADFPGSLPAIVLRCEEIVGTLWVAGRADEYRVVDIAILNAFRGNGIASALVRALIEEARSGGKVVCSSVAKSNAVSLRFHERLGFAIRGEDAVYYQLRAV